MRIAQVAPLVESVPPQGYGGTERVVAYLADELVALGHDVTLFASGDSRTAARLEAMSARALRTDPEAVDTVAPHILMLERVAQAAHQFDTLHFHVDYLHFPISRRLGVPHVTTLHGRLDISGLVPLYAEFSDMPVVSISDAQRVPLPHALWQSTVYHGLPEHLFEPSFVAGDYLLFIGRISPEKRADRAIEIARRAGLPIRIAAKIDAADRVYAQECMASLLELPFVDYLGEVDDKRKGELLRGARALVFPIDWPEPFGLVMIEAMACGTPTIAWRGGSVEEILTDSMSGFIVDNVDAGAQAVRACAAIDRRAIRREFERRFTASRMAREYVAVYEQVAGRDPAPRSFAEHHGAHID